MSNALRSLVDQVLRHFAFCDSNRHRVALIRGLTLAGAISAATRPGYAISLNHIGEAERTPLVIHAFRDKGATMSGTAFQVTHSTSAGGDLLHFFVTARHVIDGADAVEVLFNRNLNEPDSQASKPRIVSDRVELQRGGIRWWEPARDNVDIAVIFFGWTPRADFEQVSSKAEQYSHATSSTPLDEVWRANAAIDVPAMVEELPAQELADVFYSGYPLGIHSRTWISPFTRRCTVALRSTEGLPVGGLNSSDFLIDCSSFKGDSGSPVFLREVSFFPDGRLEVDSRLIGVLLGTLDWTQGSNTAAAKTDDLEVFLAVKGIKTLNLTRVAPARYILMAIQDFLGRVRWP